MEFAGEVVDVDELRRLADADSSDVVDILVALAGERENLDDLRSLLDEAFEALGLVEAGGDPRRRRHRLSHQAHDGFPVAAWVIDQRRSRAAGS